MMEQPMVFNSKPSIAPQVIISATHPCCTFSEFMKTRPSTFAGSATSWYVSEWLHTTEKKLDVVHCDDRNKVFYAAHQLEGDALERWINYCATHNDPQAIHWIEFATVLQQKHATLSSSIRKKDREKNDICTLCTKGYRSETWWCPRNKSTNCACARCGEIGHSASEHDINCSSCDGSHSLRECPMSKFTCYLCEGGDHVPTDCPLSPMLKAVTQHQREDFGNTIIESDRKPVTPIMEPKESEQNYYSPENQMKVGLQSVPKVARFDCGEQGLWTRKSLVRRHEPVSNKANSMAKVDNALSTVTRAVCSVCYDLGHFSCQCQLEPQKPTSVTTIPKATLIKVITPATGRKGKKRRRKL